MLLSRSRKSANFKTLGVRAHSLNGYERLAVLHKMFHPADNQKFRFAWDAIYKTGLSSKDFIAPDSFTFKNGCSSISAGWLRKENWTRIELSK